MNTLLSGLVINFTLNGSAHFYCQEHVTLGNKEYAYCLLEIKLHFPPLLSHISSFSLSLFNHKMLEVLSPMYCVNVNVQKKNPINEIVLFHVNFSWEC